MSSLKKTIIVGMSGGVDSSVSLILLKKAGWSPIGVSLKLPVWQNNQNHKENICCTKESLMIAQKICQTLNVPYYIFDLKRDFQKKVADYFIEEFKEYRTPNPCVICNQKFKFYYLFSFAKKHNSRYVATGHYAKIKKHPPINQYQLHMAKDKNKDQTYNLSFLPKKWLKNIIFPLANYSKDQVYQIAKKEGLEFFLKRKQSQDFCFVSGKSLPAFLKEKVGLKKGDIVIVNHQGQVVGKHQGLHFYTIGQRKRLNISKGSKPWFVQNFDIKNNILIVTNNEKDLNQKEVILSPFNFISIEPSTKPMKVMAKIRYRSALNKAILYPLKNNKIKLIFDQPQRAITPGQYCVFYQKNICLGGGRIN